MPPITPSVEELLAMLSSLRSQQPSTGPMGASNTPVALNYLLNMNPAFGYTSPGTVSSAFNPEMLIASGMFDPARVAALQESYLSRQQADWAKQLEPYLRPVDQPTDIVESMVQSNPYYAANPDIASILINNVFPTITSGTKTAEQTKNDLIESFATGELPLSGTDQSFILSEIDRFNTQLPKYLQDMAEFETKSTAQEAEAARMLESLGLSAPSIESARMQMYKDLGMPQLGLLPDITEKYTFDPQLFADKDLLERATGYETKAQERLTSELPKATDLAGRATAMSEYVASRSAAQRGEEAKQKYIQEQTAKIPSAREWMKKNPGKDMNAYVRFVGDEEKRIATVAGNIAKGGQYKWTPGTTKQFTAADVSPIVARAQRALGGVEKMRALETTRSQQEAQKLTDALTAAGITPFQQAMLSFRLPPKKK
jgi:hypothetical protein